MLIYNSPFVVLGHSLLCSRRGGGSLREVNEDKLHPHKLEPLTVLRQSAPVNSEY